MNSTPSVLKPEPRQVGQRSKYNGVVWGIDLTANAIIGALSYLYFIFGASFAEQHISLPFLDFPIFVGEIGIATLIILLASKHMSKPYRLNKWHLLIALYFVFVVVKALYGYSKWGPLAFRNAALLYYPIFMVFGFAFFRKEFFNTWISSAIIIAIIIPLSQKIYYDFWTWTAIVLMIALAWNIQATWLKWSLLAVILVLSPLEQVFRTARMAIVGNFVAGVYLMGTAIILWRARIWVKSLVVVGGLVTLMVAVIYCADRNEVVSIVNLKKTWDIYEFYNAKYHYLKADHQPYEYKNVKIYNSNEQTVGEYVEYRKEVRARVKNVPKVKGNTDVVSSRTEPPEAEKKSVPTSDPGPINPELAFNDKNMISGYRNDDRITTYNNAVYRLLVWHDLFEEYGRDKPVFGFDFGKPFRSLRLEVLGWGGQWKRDGWVPVHNSLIHMFYRTGVVGLGFILAITMMFAKLTRGFLRLRCMTGLLLCSILVTWGVCANFLLTLEFPYTAVPVWSIYGMIGAYYHVKQKEELASHELAG